MLRSSTLVLRGLRFHWRAYLGVFLGTVVAAAVLTGALAAGDSVRYSLRQMALARLGRTETALAAGDRLFQARLAADLATDLHAPTAAVLQLQGIGVADGGARRVNNLQILGVDAAFWHLARTAPALAEFADDEAAVNRHLADRLGLRIGDVLLVRFAKPEALPRDAPLALDTNAPAALRLRVRAIVTDAEFGRFGLRVTQVPPCNVFVPRAWLCRKAGVDGDRANLLLVGPAETRQPGPKTKAASLPASASAVTCQVALGRHWTLADAGLELRAVPGQNCFELRSARLFLDPSVENAALMAGHGAAGVFTYFVNRIAAGAHAAPYSFVAGVAGPPLPAGLAEDEIVLNQWLADDLATEPGATVELTYFTLGNRRELLTQSHKFKVRTVIPLTGAAADPDLMPPFPGMADAGSCRDWKPGIPLDLSQIRLKDEEYWHQYRGTPKAFISLDTAKKLWRNRFGELTAVRYPASANTAADLTAKIQARLDPATLGLSFRPVRQEALRASTQAVDFGQLFLGLSFFLVIAALLLTGMLFVFAVESRADEIGTLLALGFRPRQVRRLLLGEGTWLAGLGSLTGMLVGVAYNDLLLRGLNGLWRGAVGTSELHAHVQNATLATGALAGFCVSVLGLGLASRRLAARPILELYGGGDQAMGAKIRVRQPKGWTPTELAAKGDPGAKPVGVHASACPILTPMGERVARLVQPLRSRWQLGIAVVCLLGVAAILASSSSGRGREAAGAFFGAGALLLIAGIALCGVGLARLGAAGERRRFRPAILGIRNCARRQRRSLATIGLLACGVFLVTAVAANRHDPAAGGSRPESGTGGFAFIGETTLPILHDLNSAAGRKAYGLEAALTAGVEFVQLRVQEGDDASCLNLNRAQQPRLLGVDPQAFARRRAFSFVGTLPGADSADPWRLLEGDPDAAIIPGVADQTAIEWGLGKSLGDTISCTDETGRPFRVKLVGALANSILQGNILISEEAFLRRFPSTSGSRMLLVEAPPARARDLAPALSRAFADVGLELTPAAQRLAEFSAVENTYLSIFLILGGLGVALGSVGLGVLVLRNVMERRGELALLRAVGFSRREVCNLLLDEHGLLLAAGLVCGVLAAGVAVLPALLAPGGAVPWASLSMILAAVALNGLLWTVLAVLFATHGDLLPALRTE